MNDSYVAADVEPGPDVGRGARHIRLVVAVKGGRIPWPRMEKHEHMVWRIDLYNGEHAILTVDESEDKDCIERYLEVWEEALGWPVLRFTEHDTASTKTYLQEETQDE